MPLKILWCSVFLCIASQAFAQGTRPVLEWQQRYGGTNSDRANAIEQTADGGYIVAGSTSSDDSDVVGHHGLIRYPDCWIVRLDAHGKIEWTKCYGGADYETATAIHQTSDGGYIVAAATFSTDGDITLNHGIRKSSDYWILKLKADGSLDWQKTYGGSANEFPNAILETSDSGYVVAGYASSIDGDVLRSQGGDYWIIKLSKKGTLLWQQSLGGSYDDRASDIWPTFDGGFIIAGQSGSNDGDVSGHHGDLSSYDYWIVKLNAAGSIEWQHSYGGTYDDIPSRVRQLADSSYIVVGTSQSNDDDALDHHGTIGPGDAWVLHLDQAGEVITKRSFGGSGDDGANDLLPTPDGGSIVVGYTASNAMDGDVFEQHGGEDAWLLGLDRQGQLIWQESLGGSADERADAIAPTRDGGFAVAGWTTSIDASIPKAIGAEDFWILKFQRNEAVGDAARSTNAISVYPNPANGVCIFALPRLRIGVATLRITDVLGTEVRSVAVQPGEKSIEVSTTGLPNGTYFYRLMSTGELRSGSIEIVR